MLNFLNPAILIILPAALIPIILHFLNRTKRKEIHFSTIHFLKQMEKKEIRRLKLKQILLMITRFLMIFFLVVSFARPTLLSSISLISGKTATEVVFIIDNSLSLNSLEYSGNLLDQVRQWWLNMASFFQSSDRISVILGVEPAQILANRESLSPDFWEKISKKIQPSSLRGNLYGATLKAYEFFENTHLGNKELYIISDFQKTSTDLNSLAKLQDNFGDDVKIFLLPVSLSHPENLSVDSVSIISQILEKEQIVEIEGRLTNQTDNTLSPLISLIIQNNRVAQQNMNLSQKKSKLLHFGTVVKSDGYIEGFIEAENDGLLEDNRYYFNFFIPHNIKILHLMPTFNFNTFIPIILKPAIDEKIFSYEKMDLNNWNEINLLHYQILLLEGFNQFPDGFVPRLRQYYKRGSKVIIIPGSNVNLTNFNKLLNILDMGHIVSLRRDIHKNEEYVSLGKINWDHMIFKGLFEDNKKLNPILFNGYYKIKPAQQNKSLIFFQNGDPFLMLGEDKISTTCLLATPFQSDWSNLVIQGFVVPLVYRMIYYLVTQSIVDRVDLKAGRTFTGVYRNLEPPYIFTLKRPNGLEDKLNPVFRGKDIILQIKDNNELGNYQIWQGNNLIGVYSVNHSPEESHLEYFGESEITEIIPNSIWINPDEDLHNKLETVRFGKELWPYLLAFVIILLIFEMYLAYQGQLREQILSVKRSV